MAVDQSGREVHNRLEVKCELVGVQSGFEPGMLTLIAPKT